MRACDCKAKEHFGMNGVHYANCASLTDQEGGAGND